MPGVAGGLIQCSGIPRDIDRSHRYGSNDSALIKSATKATCALSMACREIPVSLQSKFASLIKSFSASSTFLRTFPSASRASSWEWLMIRCEPLFIERVCTIGWFTGKLWRNLCDFCDLSKKIS
jgi:hypothetical protein